MSLFSKLPIIVQKNLEQLRSADMPYLCDLCKSSEYLESSDTTHWSFKESEEDYFNTFGIPFEWEEKKIEQRKEEKLCVSSQGYVLGTGEEIARIVRQDKDIVIVDTPTEVLSKETLPDWQWPAGRERLAVEETYSSKSIQYEYRFSTHHQQQIKDLLPMMPEGIIYELGAGSGTLVHMREKVEATDLYPRHQKVKQGEMNDIILHLPDTAVVFIQYGYTFLGSLARKKLKRMKYIVVDDSNQPIWLMRSSPTVWSNCLYAFVTPDRLHAKEHNLPFTKHLLDLKNFQVYSENEFIVYLRAMGRNPGNKGPYIAGSLKEIVRIQQDIGEEVYYGPEGKHYGMSAPLEIGTTVYVPKNTVVVYEGKREFVGAQSYYEVNTYLLAQDKVFEEKDSTKVIRWKMELITQEELNAFTVSSSEGKRLMIKKWGSSTYETNDVQNESQLNALVNLSTELNKIAELTLDERIMIKHLEYHSIRPLQVLVRKGCVEYKNHKPFLTEKGKRTLLHIEKEGEKDLIRVSKSNISKKGTFSYKIADMKGRSIGFVEVINGEELTVYAITILIETVVKCQIKLLGYG